MRVFYACLMFILLVIATLYSLQSTPVNAQDCTTTILPITIYDDNNISENYIVYDGGDEIFLYDIANDVETNISNNIGHYDNYPTLEGNYVVWSGHDGNDYDIYLYDIVASQKIALTDNTTHDADASIHANYVAWAEANEIYLYELNTKTKTQLTDNSVADTKPKLFEGYLVWDSYISGFGYVPNVYDFNTEESAQILLENYYRVEAFDGNNIVFSTSYGYSQFYLYRIDTAELILLDINYTGWDYYIHISGDYIVGAATWSVDYSTDILLYQISTGNITNISQTRHYYDSRPQITGDYVVWASSRDDNTLVDSAEIYMYDINTGVKSHVQTMGTLPSIYPPVGTTLLWYGHNGDNLDEVYTYDILTGTIKNLSNNAAYSDKGGTVIGNNVYWLGNSKIHIRDINCGEVITSTPPISPIPPPAATLSVDCQPRHIADYNRRFSQSRPQLSGNYVLWYDNDEVENKGDVYFYDINTDTINFIAETKGDLNPHIDGDYVVWADVDEAHDGDIFIYEISTATTITIANQTNVDFGKTVVNGNYVVWSAKTDNPLYSDVYLYDISTNTVTNLTQTDTDISQIDIDGNYIVWQGEGTNSGLYLYDIATKSTTQVVDDAPYYDGLDVDGHYIYWQSDAYANWHEFWYNINTGEQQMFGWLVDYEAYLYEDSYIIHNESDGYDREITFYGMYAGGGVVITDNDYNDISPHIDGDYMVWEVIDVFDGIYLYDLTNGDLTKLGDGNPYQDARARIDDNYVVWAKEYDIYSSIWGIYLHAINCEFPIPLQTLTITEQELYAVIESQLTNNESIDNSIDFILVNIMPPQSNAPGGMNLTIRLKDGRTGHVFVSMIADNGLIKIQIADATPNGTDPPGQMAFRQTINAELPTILANALNTLLGDYSEIVSLSMTNDALVIEVR